MAGIISILSSIWSVVDVGGVDKEAAEETDGEGFDEAYKEVNMVDFETGLLKEMGADKDELHSEPEPSIYRLQPPASCR